MKCLINVILLTAIVVLSNLYAIAAPPTNDNIAAAKALSGLTVHHTATNVDATKEAGEPSHAGNAGGKSVWFKWTAPSSRRMMITLARSNFNTLLAVYTGTNMNDLSLVAGNDDIIAIPGAFNNRSYITFKPVAGTTYLIAVDGASGLFEAPANGDIKLDLAPVQSRASSDFDADGITDVSVFRRSSGEWYVNRSSAPSSHAYRRWGSSVDMVIAADLSPTPDGRTDYVLFRHSVGTWYVMYNYNGIFNDTAIVQWGQENDLPVTGDFLGDERTDIGVFRPSDGAFYLFDLQTGQYQIRQFGQAGDMPVVGDYDMDDKTDLAIFRPTTGTWKIELSTGGASETQGLIIETHFGQWGDTATKGDYDGDGIFDLTVFRATEGMWYTLRSTDGQVQQMPWGMSGDLAARGDYDGDGKFDYSVFRWADGVWYTFRTGTNDYSAMKWGVSHDQPGTPIF